MDEKSKRSERRQMEGNVWFISEALVAMLFIEVMHADHYCLTGLVSVTTMAMAMPLPVASNAH